MTALAPPSQRTAVVVATGVAAIVVGALVVARVVPQPLLISTAMTTFLGATYVSGRLKAFSGLAVAIVVAGSAWAFGLWCSFEGFPLWPALSVAAVVVGAVAAAARFARADPAVWAARLAPLSLLMLVAMVLSWGFAKRGVLGLVISLVFVAWDAVNLFSQLLLMKDDADDEARTARAASLLGFGAELCWNALVGWARVAPDDDASASLF